ncbi:hypothetical protein AALA90_16520 [Lachnospiraceae bacterium 38-10]
MERSVNTIRHRFYRDLILEYTRDGVQSFLYRYFWADGVSKLLEEHLPELSMRGGPQPEDEPEIRARLAETLRAHPEQAKRKLLREAPDGSRRDFWAELWLNDAGYRAGLISDTEYYFWLVEYLAKRDIYYKDTSMWDHRKDLNLLLRRGLQDGEKTFKPAQLKKDLAELAEKLHREKETGGTEIADRLHGLKRRVRVKNDTKLVDYLPWLTGRMKRMALHIRIKTWLQDGGYPLLKPEDREKAGDKARMEPFTTGPRRKRDFSLGLLEAYCSCPQGYEFYKKDLAGAAAPEGWHLNRSGFCMLDPGQIDALQNALKGSEEMPLSIPLAMDIYSGCVFFLAGKALYEETYCHEEKKRSAALEKAEKAHSDAQEAREEYEREHRKQRDADHIKKLQKNIADAKKALNDAQKEYGLAVKAKKKFENTQSLFCFDYLRLDEEHLSQFYGDVRGSFRLGLHFHENAGKSREVLLNEFQWYCAEGDDSPRARVREVNQNRPAGLRDTDMFLWAFEDEQQT